MISRSQISLELAKKLADEVVATAKRNNFSPVTVYIVDAAANIIVQQRMDSCPVVGIPQFAYAKAYTCIATKGSSRAFRDKYTTFPEGETPDPKKYCQMVGMITIADGKMASIPGGVLLRSKVDGEIIGAIGVSGAAADQDELMALTAARQFSEILSSDPA